MSKLDFLQGKPGRQVIFFGGIAFVLCFCFWYFVTSPVRTETAEITLQVDTLRSKNAQAKAASEHINEFRAAYAQAQSEYEELKALLPEQRELTSVLAGIQDRARGRLSVRRFTPKEDIQQDFYSGKPIEVEISGSYNNLGAFFADMAAYQRIVSITDFSVNRTTEQNSNRTINAQFLLTAYYVSAEKLQPTAPAAPGQPGAPATPATPAVPTAASGTAALAPANVAAPVVAAAKQADQIN